MRQLVATPDVWSMTNYGFIVPSGWSKLRVGALYDTRK